MKRIKEIFETLNISCFVNYYHILEQNKFIRSNEAIIEAFRNNNETWTEEACKTRASKGKKIFKEGLEIMALRYIINESNPQKVSQEIIDKAQKIYSDINDLDYLKLDSNFLSRKDASLTSEQILIEAEISAIEKNKSYGPEEKLALVKIRLGQSSYRSQLIDLWKGCSVTYCSNESLLIASHIKSYKDCNIQERYDKYNGLLLTPCYDKLFDLYLISFDENGEIMISNKLSKHDLSALNINPKDKLRFHFHETQKYLHFHREKFIKLYEYE